MKRFAPGGPSFVDPAGVGPPSKNIEFISVLLIFSKMTFVMDLYLLHLIQLDPTKHQVHPGQLTHQARVEAAVDTSNCKALEWPPQDRFGVVPIMNILYQ